MSKTKKKKKSVTSSLQRLGGSRHRLLHSVVATMTDGVVIIDARGTVISVNRALCTMFGYEEYEVVGRNIGMIMPEAEATEHDAHIQRYLSTGEAKVIGLGREVEGRRQDGSLFPLSLTVNEVLHGERRYFSGIMRDISDRKRAEAAEERLQALQFSNAQLERVAVAGEMAAMVAHEIRTPLNALAINVQLAERLLSRGGDDNVTGANDLLGKLKNEVQRINTLLEDYLLLVRKPDGRLRLVDVNQVISEAVYFIAHQVDQAGVRVVEELAQGLPQVQADGARLRQVLLNLLLNALQALTTNEAAPGGERRKSIWVWSALDDGEIVIGVRDDGPGIDQGVLARIFRPFVTTKPSGTGLGLAICERAVRAMRGTISATSVPEKGSTFEIRLPCPPSLADETAP